MASDTVYQQTREHLHYLGLRALADQLAPSLEAAEQSKPGYTQFLHDLLAAEVAAVEQRRLQGRLRFAKLPARKTLEQFDFTAQPNLDRRLVEDLATLRFVEERANVLLIGPPGVGKTMLATALGHRAAVPEAHRGRPAAFDGGLGRSQAVEDRGGDGGVVEDRAHRDAIATLRGAITGGEFS